MLLTVGTRQCFIFVEMRRGAYDPKTPGVADGAGKLGVSDPLHPTLDHGYCATSAGLFTHG